MDTRSDWLLAAQGCAPCAPATTHGWMGRIGTVQARRFNAAARACHIHALALSPVASSLITETSDPVIRWIERRASRVSLSAAFRRCGRLDLLDGCASVSQ